MTEEQKAAFVYATAVMLQCEVQGMMAENMLRDNRGEVPAYTEDSFILKYREYEASIGPEALDRLFNTPR